MPSKSPSVLSFAAQQLRALGEGVRAQRKALKVSGTAAAEAAGMSRVTLHRIEKGEPSVTIGAYCNALAALGLVLSVQQAEKSLAGPETDHAGWIPARVHLADYAQLRRLAWQVHGTDTLTLTPHEALDIYERNARHLDEAALVPAERQLIEALRLAFGEERGGV